MNLVQQDLGTAQVRHDIGVLVGLRSLRFWAGSCSNPRLGRKTWGPLGKAASSELSDTLSCSGAVVHAGGRHVQGRRMAGRVGCQVQPGAAFALGTAIACPRAALRRGPDPQQSPQILGQCLEAASRQPALRLLPNRGPGRGPFGIQRKGAPALITYLITSRRPLNTSRSACSRCPAASGSSIREGATRAHASSVTSDGPGLRASMPRSLIFTPPWVHNGR